jgi:hypothetical protein
MLWNGDGAEWQSTCVQVRGPEFNPQHQQATVNLPLCLPLAANLVLVPLIIECHLWLRLMSLLYHWVLSNLTQMLLDLVYFM